MARALVSVAAVMVVVIALFLIVRNRARLAQGPSGKSYETYLGLRNLMLTGSRAKFSLPPLSSPSEPWGVVMDWGVRNGTASVVALSDGSASVYMSSGGGYIGGKGTEPVRIAAQAAVESARGVEIKHQPVTAFPLPEEHGVFFYLLTDAGVFMLQTSDQELRSPTHPLKELGNAMQGVITQYRLRYPHPVSIAK